MSGKALDGRQGFASVAIHAGEEPSSATGASAPDITMSSTFVMDEIAGFSAKDLDEDPAFLYGRWGNPTVQMLERKLSALEGAEDTICLASGMAASSALFLSLLSAGDHVVLSNVCYAGVAELVRDTLPRFGIAVSLVDQSDTDAIASAMRPETRLVYLESPANPIMRLADIAGVAELTKQAGVLLAVDSTFATPVATKPIALGADIVMHSLTKYICGHGDALGGSLSGPAEVIAKIRLEAGVHYGGVLSPFNAWLIARGIATLPLRMAQHERTAMALAQHLQDHSKVTQVLYPGLPSHPQHDLARVQMANMSGMMSFLVDDGPRFAGLLAEHLKMIHYAVSLGHHRSLIVRIPTDDINETSFRLSGADLESYREAAGDGVFRFSVGLEDAADLIEDLDRVLDQL